MLKYLFKTSEILVSVFFITLFALSGQILAVGKNLGAPQGISERQSLPNISISPGAGKLRSCQAREKAIKTRMTHLTQLVTTMESKFEAIATRVETYYTTKVVPSGKSVANYDTLVTEIQSKKTAVGTTITKAQNDVNSFTCTSVNPKEQLTQFREDMQAVKKALKDYRTSIKNLIVAVHS